MDHWPVTLGVKVAILCQDEVLLVKHAYQKTWGIPGGLIERGEHPAEAGAREIHEELSMDLASLNLFGVYLNTREQKIDYVFLYTVHIDQKPTFAVDQVEIADARWWPRRDMASTLVGGRTRRRLKEIWGEVSVSHMW